MDFPRVVILEGDWFLLLDPFILGLEHGSDFGTYTPQVAYPLYTQTHT